MLKIPKIRNKILFTQEYLQKSSWTIFRDKLLSLNLTMKNTLHMNLFLILVQELILKERDFRPFWNPLCKEISEKLLSPIKIDYADSDMILSNQLLRKQEERLQSLEVNKLNLQNKNYQKICCQSFISSAVNKWENVHIDQQQLNYKSRKIRIYPDNTQKKILNEWFDTYRYVYNKTICKINNGHNVNFMELRDLLVTKSTKKENKEYDIINEKIKQLKKELPIDQKKIDILREKKKNLKSTTNVNINVWEYNTPKEIRAGAVNDVCKAYKTCITNLNNKNIRSFSLKYKKKTNPNKNMLIPKTFIVFENDRFKIAPTFFNKNYYFYINRKTLKKTKNMEIKNDIRMTKNNNEYYLHIPISYTKNEKVNPSSFCGIDPGVRSLLTTFGMEKTFEYSENNKQINIINNKSFDYIHNDEKIKKINSKIDSVNKKKDIAKKVRNKRKTILKLEKKKKDYMDDIHWKTISHLVSNYDIIFFGNIKSHNIVKNKRNHNLNRACNDLKFYIFKERLKYKAEQKGKYIKFINECYTTKTCSNCGSINDPKCSKIYNCINCNSIYDRDINAAKNILIKGLL